MKVQTEALTLESAGTADLNAGYLKLPVLATASIPAASAAYEGHLVYDTTANKLKFCTGSAWETVTSA